MPPLASVSNPIRSTDRILILAHKLFVAFLSKGRGQGGSVGEMVRAWRVHRREQFPQISETPPSRLSPYAGEGEKH